MNKEKRIPTILGLILLVGGLISGLILNSSPRTFLGKASGDCSPVNVQVSNVSHYSFVISYTTTGTCFADVSIDNKNVADIRFIDNRVKPYASKTHYFEINNLKENSKYSYIIISDGKTYKNNTYTVETAAKPNSSVPNSQLAWGKVFYSDNKPATDSILYLSIPGGSALSAMVTQNGYWYISLATSFNQAKADWLKPKENTTEEFVIYSPDNVVTQIDGNTSNNNPVPDIIIGKNEFVKTSTTKKTQTGGNFADNTTTETTTSTSTSTNTSTKTLTIDNPKDSEVIYTRKPDIFGTCTPNTSLNINIGSITGVVSSDNLGNWHWSPPTDLSIGLNILNVKSPKEWKSRNFIIASSQSSNDLSFTASQSANTPTIIPTLIPTGIISITPTLIPTSIPISRLTSIPTSIPTSTISSITPTSIQRTAKPATSSGVPVTGNMLPTITILLTALGFFLLSFSFIQDRKFRL